jgi:glucose-6-phosphate isomerase
MKINFRLTSQFANPHLSFAEDQKEFLNLIEHPNYGFFYYKEQEIHAIECKKTFEKFKHKKYFVHVGIGGSSLGPETIVKALKKNKRPFIFINNIDSDEISTQLSEIDIKESLFYIVSKSGGTAETMSALMIILSLLKEKNIDEAHWKNYFIFATDPTKSELLDFANKFQIECLPIPTNIGGRFSALTPVGLLPAYFADIAVDELISGFKEGQRKIINEVESSNTFLKTAQIIKNLMNENINETVLMPYSSRLKDLSSWFVQLWAESLGKNGKGLTPIASYGATDQHSQMQLFMDGPDNKFFFLLHIKNRKKDFKLSAPSSIQLKSFSKLNNKTLNQLMEAEIQGTLKALSDKKKQVIYIELDELSEKSLAELILWLEALTVRVAQLIKVDPFNQPGVEAGKIYAYQFLDNLKNA